MPRGVRTRITMFATTVTLAVCLLVCVALYIGLHVSLHREVDAFLRGEVQEFKAVLVHEEDDELSEVEHEIRAELGSRLGTDLTFRLLDGSGRLLITSDPDDAFANPWTEPTPESAQSDVLFLTLSSSSPSQVRFCSERANLPGRGEFIIQAAYRLDRVDQSLFMCRIVCGAALILAALLSVIGGRAVAGRSLRPVAALTQAAKQLTARRLSTRLPRSGVNDELDDLADTLNDMLQRVDQSFRQIQQFTADAAHELRTPLTALKGNAELALTQMRSEAQLRAVIEQSLTYYRILARVTDDLLLLARLDAGQETLQFERFKLSMVVEDVVDLYRPLAQERGIEIMLHCAEETEVCADQGKIRRLISNLLDNSIKYMAYRGLIDVRVHRENGAVTTSIADSGKGISKDDLPHVFERFYRIDQARTGTGNAESRSVGLGLAICRSIVDAHGGNISISSELGKGTRVDVILPKATHTSEQFVTNHTIEQTGVRDSKQS